MSQNTENIEAKLSAYIDGELDAQGRLEIERHLAANPHHQKMIEELMSMRSMLRELPRELAPSELQETLQGQLERSSLLGEAGDNASNMVLRINRWPQIIAVAAILLLAVGLASVVYLVVAPSSRPMFTSANQSAAPEDGATGADGTSTDTIATDTARKVPAGETALGTASDDARGAVPDPSVVAKSLPADVLAKRGMSELRGGTDGATADSAAKENSDAIAKADGKSGGGVGFTIAHKNNTDVPTSALYVVVQTDNPSAANDQVANYLTVNNIHWEPVAEETPLPVTEQELAEASGTPAERDKFQLNLTPTAAEGFDTDSNLAPGTGGGTGGENQMSNAGRSQGKILTDRDITGADVSAAADVAKTAESMIASVPTTNATTTAPVASDGLTVASADSTTQPSNAVPTPVAIAIATGNEGVATTQQALAAAEFDLTQRATQTQQVQQPQMMQQNMANADGTRNRVIVARQMTRRQAVELQAAMSQQDAGQRALVVDKLDETSRAVAPPAKENAADATDKQAALPAATDGEASPPAIPPTNTGIEPNAALAKTDAPSTADTKVELKDQAEAPSDYANARLREDPSKPKTATTTNSQPTPDAAEAQKPMTTTGDQPVLLPGDALRVRLVEGTKEETVDAVVGADGTVDVPGVGKVAARGLTLAELGAAIKNAASKLGVDANESISAHVDYAAKPAEGGKEAAGKDAAAVQNPTTAPSTETLASESSTQPAGQAEAGFAAPLAPIAAGDELVDVVIVVQSNQLEQMPRQSVPPVPADATTQPASDTNESAK